MRWPAPSIVTFAIAIAIPAACAAQGREARPLPPEPVRAIDSNTPDGTFQGVWSSDKDPAGVVQIMRYPNGTLVIEAPGRFQAAGFANGPSVIALTRIPGPPPTADADVRYGVLRIDRRDERTLLAHFSADIGSPPTAEETWTFRSLRPERRPGGVPAPERRPMDVVVAPGTDELPKFGEYVYVEELPEAIAKVAPDYPPSAREHGISGDVMVQALVGKDGLVQDVRVVKSIPELDAAAVACVRQWRFKPALAKGGPVAVWVAVPVRFALH